MAPDVFAGGPPGRRSGLGAQHGPANSGRRIQVSRLVKALIVAEAAQAAIGVIGGFAWAVYHVYFGG